MARNDDEFLDFEEDGYDDEPDFEEYDEDFEDAPAPEPRTHIVSGMDTFALGWTLAATIGSICLLSYFVMYQVYDWQAFGMIEPKPAIEPNIVSVEGFYSDPTISDTYNYAVVRSESGELIPGMLIMVGLSDSTPPNNIGDAPIVLMVSEDCSGTSARAYIYSVNAPSAGTPSSELVSSDSAEDFDAYYEADWRASNDLGRAIERLPFFIGVGESPRWAMNGRIAPYSSQSLLRTMETDFANLERE